MRAAVLGGGSWGTALAHALAGKGLEMRLWLRDPVTAGEINAERRNSRYLPGVALHPGLRACLDAAEALDKASFCVLAVPCQSARAVLRSLSGLLAPDLPLVCASKGLELSSLKTMSALVAEEAPQTRYAVLSGPSFAVEVALGLPAALVLGCTEKKLAGELRAAFSTPFLRVYSSADVLGVETGGALKNIVAIAAGVSDGLGCGHNARAALITRGLAEISRLGAALGARPGTFMGLSGLGDLALTCAGDMSRNRRVGLGLAAGHSLEEIRAELGQVAEGVKTTEAAVSLGEKLRVDMPLALCVRRLLKGEYPAAEAARLLMSRDLREE